MIYSSDFETVNDKNDCRVWASASLSLDLKTYFTGNSIDDFMTQLKVNSNYSNDVHWFHNLAFDGTFIMYWLFQNGYKHVTPKPKDSKEPDTAENTIASKTFTTLISDMGQFYSIEVYFYKKGKKVKKVTFYDSLKVFGMSVDEVAKAFGLPIRKLSIDYNSVRPVGHILTQEEKDYIRNDVEIIARALTIMFDQGLNKMTIGSSDLNWYKQHIGKETFEINFPKLSEFEDKFVRLSYRGGFCWVNPNYKNVEGIGKGIVLDVNSLYPSRMYYEELPIGEGVYFDGEYQQDDMYPLYVIQFKCDFHLKPNHIPTVQLKKHSRFAFNEYIEDSKGEYPTMTMTCVDLKLFLEHYEVEDLVYIGGYKYMSSKNMFKSYIEHWMRVKEKAVEEKNSAMKSIAKKMLNTLYGKFATTLECRSKIPMYDEKENKIKYRYGEYEHRDGVYLPVGTFITSYGRNYTIRNAQKVYDRFMYADTDSMHLLGESIPENLKVHDSKLGYWALEFEFIRARYLRQKTYIEEGKEPDEDCEPYLNITCSGMPSRCYENVTFDNFKFGEIFTGKLAKKSVCNGIILQESTFKLKA